MIRDNALGWLGFEGLGLHRIIGRCDLPPAHGLMERLGMRREAHFLRNQFIKGEWADEFFSFLEEEWQQAHKAWTLRRPQGLPQSGRKKPGRPAGVRPPKLCGGA
jgi:hypothetical protein